MRVLVTGGTGFVGRSVVEQLHRAGHHIVLLARDAGSLQVQTAVTMYGAELRRGDILDAISLAGACDGIDAVIHLVGIISEVGRQTFEEVHVEGTRKILTAARQAGVKRFIHMSALGTRPNAVARYHRTKWAAEKLVRGSGLEWTIFRPSIIYGPGDGFVNLFARISRVSPLVPIIGNGESKFQPIAVENVAGAFVSALSEPRALSGTFDLAGPEVFTLNQVVDQILQVTGRRRLKIHLPLALARMQAAFLEFLFGRILRKAPPLNRDQVLMLQEDNVGNGAAAEVLFALRRESFRKGIECYLRP